MFTDIKNQDLVDYYRQYTLHHLTYLRACQSIYRAFNTIHPRLPCSFQVILARKERLPVERTCNGPRVGPLGGAVLPFAGSETTNLVKRNVRN